MGELIIFTGKCDYLAAKNIDEFIGFCREKLTIFGKDLDWESPKWSLPKNFQSTGRNGASICFSNHLTSRQKHESAMQQPFLDFAKAYITYIQANFPAKRFGRRIQALRAIEFALCERYQTPSPEKVSPEIFTRAAQLVTKKYAKSEAYGTGRELQRISEFMVNTHMTGRYFEWVNPIRRQMDRRRVGKKFEQERKAKLPSKELLEAVGKAFYLATQPADIVISSAAGLLCAAPNRIGEIFELPLEVEVTSKIEKGQEAYGLRWRPKKGAHPRVKWIPPTLIDITKEAIARIKSLTSEARIIAYHYENTPNKIYLPEDLSYLRDNAYVTNKELMSLLGYKNRSSAINWTKKYNLKYSYKNNKFLYLFSDVEKAVISMLPKGFPYINKEINLKFSNALFVIQQRTLGTTRSMSRCMIEPVTFGMISEGLGNRHKRGTSSIFTRLDIKNVNGEYFSIRTHQFRHYLNDLAQREDVNQLDIAKWSGRTNIKQNQDYDHISGEELLEYLREKKFDLVLKDLTPPHSNLPIKIGDFVKLKIPTAHITQYGFCVHDWSMLPCQKHRDCINCNEHFCIKGDREVVPGNRTVC